MWIVYMLTEKGWSEDEHFDTEEKALAYKEEWLEEHPSINENQLKIEMADEWQDNFPCDFCGEEIENTTSEIVGMSAFLDGVAFTNLGYDDRVACENCCGNIKFRDDEVSEAERQSDEHDPFKTHVWLHDETGVTVENDQRDNFEALIGDLNDTLEGMYGCRICYDIAYKDSHHSSEKKIPKGKTLFDGFAIFVVEDENREDE